MTGTISYLKIANYRSLDVLELYDIKAFSVFAGPNGSGKSNFFNALDFVNWVIRFGVDEALKKHGGFENIRCLRRREIEAPVFEFEITIDFSPNQTALNNYQLMIHQLNHTPMLEERLQWIDENGASRIIQREVGKSIQQGNNTIDLPTNISMLLIFNSPSISQFLKNIRLYKIDPLAARTPVKNLDTSELNYNGRNLAGVLFRLAQNEKIYEIISEWMDLVIPGLEQIYTDLDRLDNNIRLAIKEEGLKKPLPAHLISDGTINLLSILVAMLDRPTPFGMTLIEEPENGLHPKAIMELVEDFREEATLERPIWVTTHHDSLIRVLKNHELCLVDKKQGKTEMKSVHIADKLSLSLDQAWLCNALGGGLPW